MEVQKEVLTLVQLLGMVFLFYWSATWNVPPNFDATENSPRKWRSDAKLEHGEEILENNKYLIVMDSFKSVKSVTYKALKIASKEEKAMLIPSFDAWMQQELNKKESHLQVRDDFLKKSSIEGRKLNYASSKCGAKILLSNREASSKNSILNEKTDEYMMNPCRANTWFVIELCDTIEATQIELANYELFSSSPRDFSCYWSDVFPTQRWRPLGTFQAKDLRSTQTFHLKEKNLGKFIKVVISSYYGREHFCLLSVFRVLGYSMIYQFDDSVDVSHYRDATQENYIVDKYKEEKKKYLKKQSKSQLLIKRNASNAEKNRFQSCFQTSVLEFCLKEPICLFLRKEHYVSRKKDFTTSKFENENHGTISQYIDNKQKENMCNTLNYFLQNIISRSPKCYVNSSHELLKVSINATHFVNTSGTSRTSVKSNTNASEAKRRKQRRQLKNKETMFWKKDNSVSKNEVSTKNRDTVKDKYYPKNKRKTAPLKIEDRTHQEFLSKSSESAQEPMDNATVKEESVSESAALIQKESVLTKLTHRIRESEKSLSLINRYLQQLSESYRQQMEDMQIMFNGTIKAISLASEKAAAIDEQQQSSIFLLERRVNSLNQRVEYYANGQENLLKQLLELHGFFLLLEFIISSTLFSVFVNLLKRSPFV